MHEVVEVVHFEQEPLAVAHSLPEGQGSSLSSVSDGLHVEIQVLHDLLLLWLSGGDGEFDLYIFGPFWHGDHNISDVLLMFVSITQVQHHKFYTSCFYLRQYFGPVISCFLWIQTLISFECSLPYDFKKAGELSFLKFELLEGNRKTGRNNEPVLSEDGTWDFQLSEESELGGQEGDHELIVKFAEHSERNEVHDNFEHGVDGDQVVDVDHLDHDRVVQLQERAEECLQGVFELVLVQEHVSHESEGVVDLRSKCEVEHPAADKAHNCDLPLYFVFLPFGFAQFGKKKEHDRKLAACTHAHRKVELLELAPGHEFELSVSPLFN